MGKRGELIRTARRPGAEEVLGRRPQAGGEVCASPGCSEEPAAGRRFCRSHLELLDRVRAELEDEGRFAGHERGWQRPATNAPGEAEDDEARSAA